jgi:alkyl hydroperoxide reductase subunit AhpF
MAAIVKGPLSREEAAELAVYLRERIQGRVGLEVWTRQVPAIVLTDRDADPHNDEVVGLCRQMATLHPAISVTQYDLDRHAAKAAAAGIDLAPTIVVRGAGRTVQVAGYPAGLLFSAFLEVLWFASAGRSPLTDETRTVLEAVDRDVRMEAFVTPYDPYSPHLVRLLAAFATESKRLRLRIVEVTARPMLAQQRLVAEVPVLWLDDRRLDGLWQEDTLRTQLFRHLAGDDEVVIRDHVYVAPYLTEDELLQMAAEAGEDEAPAIGGAEAQHGGGLILPGQD